MGHNLMAMFGFRFDPDNPFLQPPGGSLPPKPERVQKKTRSKAVRLGQEPEDHCSELQEMYERGKEDGHIEPDMTYSAWHKARAALLKYHWFIEK